MAEKRRIAILGSTGSIGVQALEVIENYPDMFEVEVLTAHSNVSLLIEQAIRYQPNAVVIGEKALYIQVKETLLPYNIKVFAGEESLEQIVEMETIDMVLIAIVGFAGLKPTLRAINCKKSIALANKETLVVGGNLVIKKAIEKGVNILPVDSEHSAIFQCLTGEHFNEIEKIILTASGGPFRGKDTRFLENVALHEALKHPNWAMGKKITIDSATLMNKGLEVIEAKWLFNLKPEQIDVVVHPQSIIHSLVQFTDGSLKAQMGLPNMQLPIQYALTYPLRLSSKLPRFNFFNYPQLQFEKPDMTTFPCLQLAYNALEKGGSLPCVLNAANEVAVQAFLDEKIRFLQIPQLIETAMEKISFIQEPDLDDYIHLDAETRFFVKEKI